MALEQPTRTHRAPPEIRAKTSVAQILVNYYAVSSDTRWWTACKSSVSSGYGNCVSAPVIQVTQERP